MYTFLHVSFEKKSVKIHDSLTRTEPLDKISTLSMRIVQI